MLAPSASSANSMITSSGHGMEIKPSKSHSISIVKGKLTNDRFYINKDPIPTVLEQPIKGLRCCYDANLKDSQQVQQMRMDTITGLRHIDKSALPGKLKVLCLEFGLLPRLMWPLSMYEVVHIQVLRCLAAELEEKRKSTNASPHNAQATHPTPFLREVEKRQANTL